MLTTSNPDKTPQRLVGGARCIKDTGLGNIPVPPQNNGVTVSGNAPVPPQNSSMTGIGNASVLPKDHVPPKLESDLASSASAEVEAQEILTSDGAEALDQKEKRD